MMYLVHGKRVVHGWKLGDEGLIACEYLFFAFGCYISLNSILLGWIGWASLVCRMP